MNRIILIGNGFDLAHGLSTKYEDFINWYWEQWGLRLLSSSKKEEEDVLCSFRLKDEVGLASWYLVWAWHYQIITKSLSLRDIVDLVCNDEQVCEFHCHSILFQRICKSIESKGWVDIEVEYYEILKSCALYPENNECTCSELNRQMNFLKIKLIEYLSSLNIDEAIINYKIKEIIYAPFNPDDISIKGMIHLVDHFKSWINKGEKEWGYRFSQYNLLKNDLLIKDNIEFCNKFSEDSFNGEIQEFILRGQYPKEILLPDNIMLLDFNYTPTSKFYLTSNMGFCHNQIHGALDSTESVIFGYGDELEDHYNEIVKLNDNKCLQNIKSIKYLESNKYRKMLSFIESSPFQILVMGHSCGNSDRTLLNTLFEHKNCVSIKPYYYQKEDGSDNYLDIIQNVSRSFTDMKLMRDRVVNKTFCEPLPQNRTNN